MNGNRTAHAVKAHHRGIGTIGAIAGVAVCGAVLIGVGMGFGLIPKPNGGGDQLQTDAIDLHTVVTSSFDVRTTAHGELGAKQQITLRNSLKWEAAVIEIIDEGTEVKKGDVLVRLDAETIRDRIEEKTSSVNAGRSDVVSASEDVLIQQSENDSQLRKAELNVTLKELELRRWEEGELKTRTVELRRAVEKAVAEEQRLSEKVERSRELQAEGFISSDELKQHERDFDDAVADLERAGLAETTYHTYDKPKDRQQRESDVAEAIAELDRVKLQNASRMASKNASLKNQEAQLEILERSLAEYEEQLELTEIVAPSDGLVVYAATTDRRRGSDEEPLTVGSKVYPNQAIIVLPDTSKMLAEVKVHESLAGAIKPGQSVKVNVDAVRDKLFDGIVQSVSVLAEGGGWRDPDLREYTVSIELQGGHSDQLLKPAMRCIAMIQINRVEEVISVPTHAVLRDGMVQYVNLVEQNGKVRRRVVQPGLRSNADCEIRVGLDVGDRVLLRAPIQNEASDDGWNVDELRAVGLDLNEDGRVVRQARAGR